MGIARGNLFVVRNGNLHDFSGHVLLGEQEGRNWFIGVCGSVSFLNFPVRLQGCCH